MSLRREIHSAFDVIAPPLGGMPERMVQTVLAEQKARGRKRTMLLRLRAPLSLVAVLVIIALVAAVLVGGRLVQDWNTRHSPAPAGAGNSSSVSLEELEARPVNLPLMKATDLCNDGPLDPTGRYGTGPVFGIGANPVSSTWGDTWDLHFAVSKQVTGWVLIRGRDLKTGQSVLWRGEYANGPIGDPGQSDLHTEVAVDLGPKPRAAETQYPITSALKAGHSDCAGFQIDGSNFSEHFAGGA